MKTWALLFGLSLSAMALSPTSARKVTQMGEVPPDMCWTTADEWMMCLSDIQNAVVVLMYGAGWCPGCNEEAADVSNRFSEMQGKPVIFVSLVSEGFSHGASVDTAFLKAWKKKHGIPFIVAAAPRDPGKQFFAPPNYIPAVAVLDGEGKLAYKDIEPNVTKLFSEVNRLIGQLK